MVETKFKEFYLKNHDHFCGGFPDIEEAKKHLDRCKSIPQNQAHWNCDGSCAVVPASFAETLKEEYTIGQCPFGDGNGHLDMTIKVFKPVGKRLRDEK